MSRLFIGLYFDEDVDVLVATLIKARGFSTTTTVEAGNLGKTDVQQLEFAAQGAMALVTHNRVDFDELAKQWVTLGRVHSGLLLCSRRPAYEVARRLLTILNQVMADEMDNQVRYL